MRTNNCAICGHAIKAVREPKFSIIHDCLVLEFNSKDQIVEKRWFSIHKLCYEELFLTNTED